jgi:hypothetical protein
MSWSSRKLLTTVQSEIAQCNTYVLNGYIRGIVITLNLELHKVVIFLSGTKENMDKIMENNLKGSDTKGRRLFYHQNKSHKNWF